MEFIDLLSDETVQNDFERIELSETQQIIADALAGLRECDRQLIKMRFWSEFSYEAIGKAFGITKSAVAVREKKILRKLRLNDTLRSLYYEFNMHYKGIEI